MGSAIAVVEAPQPLKLNCMSRDQRERGGESTLVTRDFLMLIFRLEFQSSTILTRYVIALFWRPYDGKFVEGN